MCELLVMLEDRLSDDPYLDVLLPKRGDAINVREDGAEYGRKEGAPTFKVVRLPGVPPVECQGLLGKQFAAEPNQTMMQFRAFGLNVELLRDHMTLDELRGATVAKPFLPDPNVLG